MAESKTVIIACTAVFLIAVAVVVATRFAPAPDPVAHLDGRFLPDSGDTNLQAWAKQPDSAPLPTPRPLVFSANITDTPQKQLALEYNELREIPDVTPGPLVTLEPGQTLETDSGSFRLTAFAVYDSTRKPMRLLQAVNAKGESMTEAERAQAGIATNVGEFPSQSHLLGILLFTKTPTIRPVHPRMLTSPDTNTAMVHINSTYGDSGKVWSLCLDLPVAPLAHPSFAFDVYTKPEYVGKLNLGEKSTLNCGAFGEPTILANKTWTIGRICGSARLGDRVEWTYTGSPKGTLAIVRIPDGVASDRYTFHPPSKSRPYATRIITNSLIGLAGSENDTEAEVRIHRSAQRVIQKLPPIKYPEFTAGADPLDWPIPNSLTTSNLRMVDGIRRMTGLWLNLKGAAGLDNNEPMSAYADCRTTRDVLRKISAKLAPRGLELQLDRKRNYIYAREPEPTPFRRFLKYIRTLF